MNSKLKILILEDSPDDADLIERELRKAGLDFSSIVVNQRVEFEAALHEVRPDVILSDHSLPSFNSLEALKLYHDSQSALNLAAPFILITGAVSEEFAVQCIKAGADDYILKDRLKRLPAAIQSAMEKSRIESERRKILKEVIANEAMMKEAEQMAHFGSWQIDMTTGKHKWSDETFRIYGYSPGEIEPTYEIFLSHVHPDDREELKDKLDQALLTEDHNKSEMRIIDKQGKVKYIESKVLIRRNSHGSPVSVTGFNMDVTDTKNADIQLQKSQLKYKSLFDQNPDGVYSLDLKGNFTNANKALVELAGLDAGKLLQIDFKRFLTEEDADFVNAKFKQCLNGEAQRYQAKFLNSHGTEIILDITNMPILVNNQIVGVHGIAKDITKNKELELLLDKVHRLAMIGGWEMDVESQKISWTPITKEIHEVPADFIPDADSGMLFYKEGINRQTVMDAVEHCKVDGKPFDLELEITTAKGNPRWVRVIGNGEFKDGKCIRLFGSFQDIHERKRAEETLKEADKEKIAILESIADAFFAVDKNGVVTYWNNIAEEKLHVPKEKIVGKNLWDVFNMELPDIFQQNYYKALNENVVVHFQEYYPPGNMWLDVSVFPSSSGLSIYFRDITELRKYTAAIELQNAKLKEIGWIQSHEVRAPLARIMGLINLIRDAGDAEINHIEILDLIMTSAKELDGLIRTIVRKTESLEGEK
ncbi:MAG TPA: PAS domain S-box protein [Ohtaekwangia sp.]|nr:PAS domain S-box protein [Ohtaekwangia sp.]